MSEQQHSSSPPPPPPPIKPSSIDPYKLLNISPNPSNSSSIIRHPPHQHFRNILPNQSQNPNPIFKDILINPQTNTSIRLFRPSITTTTTTTTKSKTHLPIIIYFHGGGFVLFSNKSNPIHQSCINMAFYVTALVVSVEYRLAPENRLPAAYEDAVESVKWVREQAAKGEDGDAWLRDYADFNDVFLMGTSAGANIAYNAYLLLGPDDNQGIRGLILDQPYFGGETRTESELKLANDKILPLTVNDLLWTLSLPLGANRDHKFSNPMSDQPSEPLTRCLVRGYGGDPLHDRQRMFCTMLESCGTEVVIKFDEDGFHGIEMFKLDKAKALYQDVMNFMYLGGHRARSNI